MELEQYDEAIAAFGELLDKDPTANNIRLYRGIAYEDKGQLDKAYAEYTLISRTSEQYIDAAGHIALILKEQGKGDEAIATLKDAIGANPGNLELYLNLSSLYESLNRPQAALEFLLANEEHFLKESRLHFHIGVLLDKLGKRSESIKRMKEVLKLDATDAQALNYLGYTYVEMGLHLEEALELIKRAVAIRPKDAFILDSLGWAYFKLKRYDDATEALEEAVSLVDDDSTIVEHLADIYAARHFHKRSLRLYQKAMELAPERKELAEKFHKAKGELSEK